MSRSAIQRAWLCLARIRRTNIPNLLGDLGPFFTTPDKSMQTAGCMDAGLWQQTSVDEWRLPSQMSVLVACLPFTPHRINMIQTVRWPSGLRRQLKVLSSDTSIIRWSERAWVQIPLSSKYLLLFVPRVPGLCLADGPLPYTIAREQH